MVNQMEWESFNGIMEKLMKDNGVKVRNMDQGFGKDQKVIHILESGNKVLLMDMEFING